MMANRTIVRKLARCLLAALFMFCAALAIAFLLPDGSAGKAQAADSGHTGHGADWTALTEEGGKLTDGKYYLAADTKLTADLTVSGTVTLCLNGHILTGTGESAVIIVERDADFTLCDCREGAADVANVIDGVTYNSGVITGGTGRRSDTTSGGGIRADYDTVFIMNGGAIVGNRADLGGGVHASGDVFIMNGGTIAGNTATGDIYGAGGGVCVWDCAFLMNGGTIAGNTAETEGGGVYMVGDVLDMNGGTIADNTAPNGSGVILSYSTFTISGGYFGTNSIAGDTANIIGGYFAGSPQAYADAGYFNSATHTVMTLSEEEHYGDEGFVAGYPYAVYGAPSGYYIEDVKTTYGTAYVPATTYEVQNSAVTYSWEEISGEGDSAGEKGTGLPQDAGVYTVTANFAEDIDVVNKVCFPQGTAEFTVTVEKADYDMSGISFNDATYTYDGSEKTLTIAGTLPDGVSVEYTTNSLIDAGSVEVTASFTGDTANYNAIADMTATLTVEKADYDMSGISFNDATYTYDGSEKTLMIAGTLPDGVSVEYTTNSLTDAGSVEVTASFTGDTANYNAIADMTAILTVERAAPTYTLPEDLTATEGDTLADVALPDGWSWTDDTLSVGEAGDNSFAAVYTPADTVNYDTAQVQLTITVSAAAEDIGTEPGEEDEGGCNGSVSVGSAAGAAVIVSAACALIFKKGKRRDR